MSLEERDVSPKRTRKRSTLHRRVSVKCDCKRVLSDTPLKKKLQVKYSSQMWELMERTPGLWDPDTGVYRPLDFEHRVVVREYYYVHGKRYESVDQVMTALVQLK